MVIGMKEGLIDDLETILITEEAIQERLEELRKEVHQLYQGQELTVISIINGALIFTADLIRKLTLPLQLDCIRVSSYRDSTRPEAAPRIMDRMRLDLRERHVLIIDDILDTGNTLSRVVAEISESQPASLRTCVLLDKKARREIQIDADLVGFEIPDEFVVGYGLDFAESYRHLPCIGVLKPEFQNPPNWK